MRLATIYIDVNWLAWTNGGLIEKVTMIMSILLKQNFAIVFVVDDIVRHHSKEIPSSSHE